MSLNPRQKEAVEHTGTPQLILAGAGSGKTRVIIYKIAHLITEHNVKAYNILAVTFTNKAAEEIKERTLKQISGDANGLRISTFHSTCLLILRSWVDRLEYMPNFVIYDSTDQLSLIKESMKALDISAEVYDPKAILYTISGLKNRLISLSQYTETAKNFGFEHVVASVFKHYQKGLLNANAVDFDDIIVETVSLLKNNDDVREHYEKKFKYVLVDEYQDINTAQYELLHLIASKHRNIYVVGDDDQSIYKFRGADSNNFLRFEKDFPELTITKLEQNYRSTKTILTAANAVVTNNKQRNVKELWTNNPQGEKIICFTASNEMKEASFIKNKIKEKVADSKRSYSDFAVLYRVNSQSRVLEDAMRQSGIKYRVVGGLKFYDRKEIKDMICYMRFMLNPHDNTSLLRILNTPPRGIGQSTLAKVTSQSRMNNISIFDVLLKINNQELEGISPRIKNNINKFIALVEYLRNEALCSSGSSMLKEIIEKTGYVRYLSEYRKDESARRIENIEELVTAIVEFEESNPELRLGDFLDQVALYTADEELGEGDTAVTLMTLHSAKGLEFSEVFITGIEQGLLPHFKSEADPSDLEEERRLCYVGMTRAKENLYLTNVEDRRIHGSAKKMTPSIFLSEIPEELKDIVEDQPEKFTIPNHFNRPNRYITHKKPRIKVDIADKKIERPDFERGDNVIHEHWGAGQVMEAFGSGEGLKVIVNFKTKGKKMLAMKYTSLDKQ